MQKTYHKPEVIRIELRPMEAALGGCKTTLDVGGAAGMQEPFGDYGCVYPGTGACSKYQGS